MKQYLRGFRLYGLSIKSFQWILYRLRFNYPQLFNNRPVHLDLELSSACNLKCDFCYRQDENYKIPNKFMSFISACHVLTEAYKAGFRSVKLNWRGEPTLSPDLIRIVNAARAIGYLDIIINTNGTNAINNNLLDEITELRISVYDVKYAQTSFLNNIPELKSFDQKEIRGVYLYPKYKDKIIIQYFDMEIIKQHYLDDCYKCIKKTKQPRTSDNKETSYFDLWKQGKMKRRYCKQPAQRIVVGWDLKAHACCLNYNEDETLLLGNVLTDGFEKIIDNAYRHHLIDCLKHDDFDKLPVCLKCTSFTAYEDK